MAVTAIYDLVRAGVVDLPAEREGNVQWAAGAKDRKSVV